MDIISNINKLKDAWLESAIKNYADDVRQRHPHRLKRWERALAPLIIKRYAGTIANLITVIRILLAIIIFLLIIIYALSDRSSPLLIVSALILFIGAGFLDLLDGPTARALNEISETGKIMDPLADKLLLAAPFLILAYVYLPSFTYRLIIAQEIFLIFISLAKMAASKLPFTMASQANLGGKVKNILELTAGAFLFLCPFGSIYIVISNILFLASVPVAVISIAGYLSSVRRK